MSGEEKFNTCRFRSSEAIDLGNVGLCCGAKRESLFICFKRNIEGVTPTLCLDCQIYEKKFEEIEE